MEETEADIKQLESRLIKGPDPEATELLKQRHSEADDLKKKLTFEVATEKPLDPQRASDGSIISLHAELPQAAFIEGLSKLVTVMAANGRPTSTPSLSQLLAAEKPNDPLPGSFGYQLDIAPSAKLDRILGCPADAVVACTAIDRTPDQMIATRDLVYLRAVPAGVSLAPIWKCAAAPCSQPNGWGEEASAKAPITLPQLARLSTLPTGGASIFGSHTVGASFDALGEP